MKVLRQRGDVYLAAITFGRKGISKEDIVFGVDQYALLVPTRCWYGSEETHDVSSTVVSKPYIG